MYQIIFIIDNINLCWKFLFLTQETLINVFIHSICHFVKIKIYNAAEVQRTRKDMDIEIEKLERQKENLNIKLAQTEKDLQLALKQEQQAHEEDLDRLTKDKVIVLLKML